MSFERNYMQLVSDVVTSGETRKSRAGNTRALFGCAIAISDLADGFFPVLTMRKIYYKPVLGELAAFLRGSTNLADFKAFGCNYWDANAAAWKVNRGHPVEKHLVGRIYGTQWRQFTSDITTCAPVDQLALLIAGLKKDPYSRRHLLTTYHPAELSMMCLPPCHLLAQYNVTNDGDLECCVYMRSVDLMLGLPADVILYATLLILLAAETGYKPGKLVFMLGDTHVYENHLATWEEHKKRAFHQPPTWKLAPTKVITEKFVPSDLILTGYHFGERLDYKFNV